MRACVMVVFVLAWPILAAAQSWTTPLSWTSGQLVTAAQMNTYVSDNTAVLRAGGITVTSQATGDLWCASSSTQWARLASVATGQVLTSAGVGTCPAFSGSPTLTLVRVGAGSAGAPSLSFSGDTDTGFYTSGANTIDASVGGTNIMSLDANQWTLNTGYQVGLPDGSAAAPTLVSTGDADSGWYRSGDTMSWGWDLNSAADIVSIEWDRTTSSEQIVFRLVDASTPVRMALSHDRLSITDSVRVKLGTVTFANLSSVTPANGDLVYCSDCSTVANPGSCASAGSGALAFRQGGTWVCVRL